MGVVDHEFVIFILGFFSLCSFFFFFFFFFFLFYFGHDRHEAYLGTEFFFLIFLTSTRCWVVVQQLASNNYKG